MQRVNTVEYVEGLFKKIRDLELEVQALKDKYQRDVFGLNNEGDPIGGDPAGGYANDLANLKAENERLQSFKTAYMEWSDKTDWVQESAHWS